MLIRDPFMVRGHRRHIWRLAVSLLLSAGVALSAGAGTAEPQPKSIACPPAATSQVDGFYRWFLATQDPRQSFPSQRQRFTPELYRQLRAGFALQPSDGRFVDFDPFSNTQVMSYGHRIACCRQEANGLLVMRVDVRAGLSPARASNQQLDYVLTPTGNSWRIGDIRYPGEASFSMRQFLEGLLKQR